MTWCSIWMAAWAGLALEGVEGCKLFTAGVKV